MTWGKTDPFGLGWAGETSGRYWTGSKSSRTDETHKIEKECYGVRAREKEWKLLREEGMGMVSASDVWTQEWDKHSRVMSGYNSTKRVCSGTSSVI